MEMIFRFFGKLLFPRLQDWEQVRMARTFSVAVGVGLGLAAVLTFVYLKRGHIGN